MGGEGSGRRPSEETIIRRMTPIRSTITSPPLELPNYSGVQQAALKTSTALSAGLIIKEVDGSPTGTPDTLKVSNGTLTDNGDGSFTLVTGGTPAGSDTQIQYNSSGSFGASSKLIYTDATPAVTISGGSSTTGSVLQLGPSQNAYGTRIYQAGGDNSGQLVIDGYQNSAFREYARFTQGGLSFVNIGSGQDSTVTLKSGTSGTYKAPGIYFDGENYYDGDTYINKTAVTGGNWRFFYDNAEVLRDDGTNWRVLHGRRMGGYTAIGDTNPATRFGGNHKMVITAVPSTATTNEEDLITYALPSALLSTNGDRIDVCFNVTFGATARTKRLRSYFGSTVTYDTGAVIFNGGQAQVRMTVVRTGATAQVSMGIFNGDVTLITALASYTTPAETLSGAITVKITSTVGAGASANDVIAQFATIDYLPVGA